MVLLAPAGISFVDIREGPVRAGTPSAQGVVSDQLADLEAVVSTDRF